MGWDVIGLPGARDGETAGPGTRPPPLRWRSIESRTTLPYSPTSVGAARRFVRDVLTHRNISEQSVETVELLASEVVTNALIHAGSRTRHGPDLTLRVGRGVVRVEVYDRSPAVPVRLQPAPLEPSGRGMWIVDGLARDWGIDHLPTGKRVWFEVAVRHSPVSAWWRNR